MNQNQFVQLAESLHLDTTIIHWIALILTVIGLLIPFITLIEKLGVINWIMKWISPKIDYEEEIVTIDLLTNFKVQIEGVNDDNPYAIITNQQKEIVLLNRFYNSRLEDLYLLRYCMSRKERKRAFRLSRHTIFPIFIKKDLISNGYILRKFVVKPFIYTCLTIWILIYASITLGLLYLLMSFYKELNLIQILAIYLCAAILPLSVGWLLGFLLVPFQAKSFVELKKYNEL